MISHLVYTILPDFTSPSVPIEAEKYLPQDAESFGDGLWYVIKHGFRYLAPDLYQAGRVCCALIAVAILISIIENLSSEISGTTRLVGIIASSTLLFNSANTLIRLGTETVSQVSDYGKLLVPVLSSALAAQGGSTSAVFLYSGTVLFNTILTSLLTKFLLPGIYIYLAVCIANRAIENNTLSNIAKFIKNTVTWVLKTAIYIFTGYMSVTGVVSGSVDAASVKAAKLTISGSVPVIGGILSDASEAFLAGVSIAKNTAGIAGLLAILAILIGPFLEVGAQYILLKATGTISGIFNSKGVSQLIEDFSSAMGLLLAANGAIGFIHVFSTVCFIRGIA